MSRHALMGHLTFPPRQRIYIYIYIYIYRERERERRERERERGRQRETAKFDTAKNIPVCALLCQYAERASL